MEVQPNEDALRLLIGQTETLLKYEMPGILSLE